MREIQVASGISSYNLSTLFYSVFLSVSIYLVWRYGGILLSRLTHLWLRIKYKTFQVGSTVKQLPTEPYVWPDGQGNLAKFIHGKENSELWNRKHGSVYRIWSGVKPEVVLTKAEHVMAVFKDSHLHTKAVDNNSGYILKGLLGSCLGLISGPEWQKLHTVFQPHFTHARSADYLDIVTRHTTQHLDQLESKVSQTKLFDPVADFRLLPFSIIVKILYGPLPPSLLEELFDLIPLRERVFGYAVSGGISRFGALSWLPLRSFKELRDFQQEWSEFNDKAHAHANSHNSLAPIVNMYTAVNDGTITRPQLLQTLDEIIFANLDVTMGAISWCLVFLAAHPTVQARLRSEIKASSSSTHASATTNINENPLNSSPSMLKTYHTDSKSYLSAIIHESSRLRPLAAFSVPQSAPTPRVISSYHIPQGTDFIIDSHALNTRDTEYWGDDALKFRPDRFLEKWRAREQGRGVAGLRFRYWRFGFGPRQCLGKYVADLMIRVLLAEVVGRWEMGLVGREEKEGEPGWDRDLDTWIMHPTVKIAVESVAGSGS